MVENKVSQGLMSSQVVDDEAGGSHYLNIQQPRNNQRINEGEDPQGYFQNQIN